MNEENIKKAYDSLNRQDFMDEFQEFSHHDAPFSIGHGQTISQPSLVLSMTLALNPTKHSIVLELGTGSGFQTALLALISKEVYTVERIELLHLKAISRLMKLNYKNIHYKLDDGNLGWEEEGPYDRIMATAAAHRLPEILIKQLSPQGKMVIPVKVNEGQDLVLVEKSSDNQIYQTIIDKVRFEDLIGEY